MNPEKKTASLEQRLKRLSAVTRLGHEAFRKPNFNSLLLHILNNTQLLYSYSRASLIDFRSGKPVVSGVSGESKVNHNSEYCVNIRTLLKHFSTLDKPLILNEESLKSHGCSEKAETIYKNHFKEKNTFLLPFLHPDDRPGMLFIWVVELDKIPENPETLLNMFFLLANHYSEALWYRLEARSFLRGKMRLRTLFRPETVFVLLLVAFIVSLITVRVRLKAVAPFEFTPVERNIVYAPFSGTISQVMFESGDEVKTGYCIVKYDTEELMFDKLVADKRLAEINAELELAKAKSFHDVEYRGKIKILDLRLEQQLNKLKKFNWYLQHSDVKADSTGILLINDKNILTGKKVSAGEKLFEIISQTNIQAEVLLDEKDAVVLGKNLKIVLYPHIMPETPLTSQIITISPVPLLAENKRFSYIIKLSLPENSEGFFCGMRGIANLYGRKVSLGYYLFRSLIVWWRKI